jgi:hypothetical protein
MKTLKRRERRILGDEEIHLAFCRCDAPMVQVHSGQSQPRGIALKKFVRGRTRLERMDASLAPDAGCKQRGHESDVCPDVTAGISRFAPALQHRDFTQIRVPLGMHPEGLRILAIHDELEAVSRPIAKPSVAGAIETGHEEVVRNPLANSRPGTGRFAQNTENSPQF